MKLYRLTVLEEFVVAETEDDAIKEAFGDAPALFLDGYNECVEVEEIEEPMATILLTKDELLCVASGKNPGLAVKDQIERAIMSIAVQTVLVRRGGSRGGSVEL